MKTLKKLIERLFNAVNECKELPCRQLDIRFIMGGG